MVINANTKYWLTLIMENIPAIITSCLALIAFLRTNWNVSKVSKKQDEAAIEIVTLKHNVNGMKDDLVTSVKEAAGLAGEQRGREQIATTLVVTEAVAQIKELGKEAAQTVKTAVVEANGLKDKDKK